MGDATDWVQNLTLALAPMPDLWRRLLGLHVADSSGRCRGCTRAGTGTPDAVWPCAIQIVAERARLRCAATTV